MARAHLDRRTTRTMSITDGKVFVDAAASSCCGSVERLTLPAV